MMILYIFMGSVTILAALLTYCVLKYSKNKQFVDVPNHRSSHVLPTPKGGGVAIVVTFTLGLFCAVFFELLFFEKYYYLLFSGLLIAAIGLIDDIYTLASKKRLVFHFTAALILVFAFGGIEEINIETYAIPLKWFSYPVAILAIIWLLNLYNFMDGIDGLASIEAVTVAFTASAILYYQYGFLDVSKALLIFGFSVLGFLFFNFPKAKIFLGDVGSAYIGVILSGFALITININSALLWVWLILLASFIGDATYTLFKRLLNGKRPDEAHRSHTYQKASRKLLSHSKVSLGVFCINVFWLFPLAYIVAKGELIGAVGALLAYVPIIFSAIFFKAGIDD